MSGRASTPSGGGIRSLGMLPPASGRYTPAKLNPHTPVRDGSARRSSSSLSMAGEMCIISKRPTLLFLLLLLLLLCASA
jgi:hypothetical protein